ncbi:hypothetical protein GZH47_07925 [Paenibacillus rhizovicinus]|uniref:Uncharacterized protein n=1 Tax=Paenibacillus rhizovicinus TaxID=2704463 RepID=A0A6C0P278_9BACL|nr:hypothetical protein [Paenibacillus rhizovicinus]QHW30792.1 hypothetical protein GZH47_07925 [Paenibacillus rhizovicinus]
MPASSRKTDLAFMLEDTAEKLLKETLIDYYLQTRNFKAIEQLLSEADAASSSCSFVWVWAMDMEGGSAYIPETEMAAIKARIKALAASGDIYIADPYYFMDSQREELVKAYMADPGNLVYIVPNP